jgi:hypothetical protein
MCASPVVGGARNGFDKLGSSDLGAEDEWWQVQSKMLLACLLSSVELREWVCGPNRVASHDALDCRCTKRYRRDGCAVTASALNLTYACLVWLRSGRVLL